MSEQLDIEEVVQKYSKLDVIWDERDKWHYYVHTTIKDYITQAVKNINTDSHLLILNAGSAGEEYDLTGFQHIHLDIVEKNIQHTKNYVVASIEQIPLQNNSFDIILCVGSVLNYSDALQSLSEFSRLLKQNAYLILELELSGSFEYIFTKHYLENVSLVKTFYQNKEEKLWVYSENYIKNILDTYDLKFINEYKFHILSGIIYKLTNNPSFATKFSNLDKFLSKYKLFSKFASNVILTYQKK
ncbi:class I SAM-dependent methyltransferase [uncultured Arcobacter sp.]|uniref:class I SAM-dependent methyltransferase n=1 Tax=uncultured Arcobacter sp. TaxID=165434 RepID=UPI00262EFA86|nr:class I SAM-dependent methyltransferase [uncultured Arcobacter sp.]